MVAGAKPDESSCLMDGVPAELLKRIFAELDQATRFNASLTCCRWKKCLSPQLPDLKHLHIALDSMACNSRVIFHDLRDTSTIICQCNDHLVVQSTFLREICQRFGDRLSSVIVEDSLLYKTDKEFINDYSIHVVLRECGEKLKELEFHELNLQQIHLWTLVIMARFSALISARFYACRFPHLLTESIFTRMLTPSFSTLETIVVTDNDLISDKFTRSVAKQCSQLRELDVSGCSHITAVTAIGFCESLPQRGENSRPLVLHLRNTLFNVNELLRHLENPLLSCGPKSWTAKPLTVNIAYDREAILLTNFEHNDLLITIFI